MSGLQKNVASQKYRVFAFDTTDGTAKTGDAAQITAKIDKDWAGAGATDDTNPTEVEDGYYLFTLTQAETNADVIDFYPESSTGSIQVIGVPGTVYTVPPNFSALGVESDGDLTKVNLCATTTTNTDMVTEPPTAAAVVNEWESQSQDDPTGFHVNVKEVSDTAQTANDNGADINTLITQVGTAGDGLTAINLPNQTMDIIGDITGNLSGSVGSVTAEVDADVKKINAVTITGDGDGTPFDVT